MGLCILRSIISILLSASETVHLGHELATNAQISILLSASETDND